MRVLLSSLVTFAFLPAALAGNPAEDFLADKGVGEASLRVMRNLPAPDIFQIEKEPVEYRIFSQQCGIVGCAETYLAVQKFTWNPGANIQSGSVAALVRYDVLGSLDSVEVVAESFRK